MATNNKLWAWSTKLLALVAALADSVQMNDFTLFSEPDLVLLFSIVYFSVVFDNMSHDQFFSSLCFRSVNLMGEEEIVSVACGEYDFLYN